MYTVPVVLQVIIMKHKLYAEKVNMSIKTLKGIGPKKALLLEKIGIYSIWDLLYTFPRGYEDRTRMCPVSTMTDGLVCCVNVIVASSVIEKKIKPKMSLYIFRAQDSTGELSVKWFSSPFNRTKIKRGMKLTLYGTVSVNKSGIEFLLKDYEQYGENNKFGRVMPVYSSTAGLSQNDLKTAVKQAFEIVGDIPDSLPEDIVASNDILPLEKALYYMHFPDNYEILSRAKYRFSFEELLILCMIIKKTRQITNQNTSVRVNEYKCILDFANSLPFELTDGQKKAVNDICKDFKKSVPMNRLLQGDVGSGKTVVAACASYAVFKSGYQTAVMAPTEILAAQHYETFVGFFKNTDIRIGLLTSSTANKTQVYKQIQNGELDIVIGTHALIQDKVNFKNLGLCITDEQHRFGVKQRALLAKSNNNPHILVMSATPIPRTLSLVVYGDLDISVIDVLPTGRQKIETYAVNNSLRQRINGFIKNIVESGSQCFVVCPLIDTSEKLDVLSGAEAYENLKQYFPEYRICFLHGKMSNEEKDEIMEAFRKKEYDILVSTTVIEVGIDIPNATLIIVENAERFGLSQLHQLRGRVGRGTKKSYCVLVTDSQSQEAKERMDIMCKTNDGFKVAAYDLQMRGCGEFFGTRQHGLPELKVANLFTDMQIFEKARDVAEKIEKTSPKDRSSYNELHRRIERLISDIDNMKIFN